MKERNDPRSKSSFITGRIPNPFRNFHERTLEAYKEAHPETREGWRQLVMRIHEESGFLFYFDDSMEMYPETASLLVLGEHVKGELPVGSALYLYTGQGEYLGSGRLMSSPEEKEQGRKGLLKRRRNEFLLELTDLGGTPAASLPEREIRRCFNGLLMDLSLISDKKFQE